MIRGVHTMFYSSQPEELRAFLRDKLGFQGVGDGWLIFDLPEADMGCHPPGRSRSSVGYTLHLLLLRRSGRDGRRTSRARSRVHRQRLRRRVGTNHTLQDAGRFPSPALSDELQKIVALQGWRAFVLTIINAFRARQVKQRRSPETKPFEARPDRTKQGLPRRTQSGHERVSCRTAPGFPVEAFEHDTGHQQGFDDRR